VVAYKAERTRDGRTEPPPQRPAEISAAMSGNWLCFRTFRGPGRDRQPHGIVLASTLMARLLARFA